MSDCYNLLCLHINNNHWIVALTMKNGVDITVYDSLNASISTTTKVILAKLVCSYQPCMQDLLTIEASKVNTQSGMSDGGMFACAYVAIYTRTRPIHHCL